MRAIWRRKALPPVIHELYSEVIRASRGKKVLEIEKKRSELSQNTSSIDFHSFGAPSKVLKHESQLISKIASSSLASPEDAYLLGLLAKSLHAKSVLELGTSLGITTAYIKTLNPDCQITSMEGNDMILDIAKGNNNDRINFISGNIDDNLPSILEAKTHLDFVIMDANHTHAATLNYFEQILPKCHENSCIIVDDIYWSKGMNRAWKTIIAKPEVTFSIDLFGMGLLLFTANHEKQHFNLFR